MVHVTPGGNISFGRVEPLGNSEKDPEADLTDWPKLKCELAGVRRDGVLGRKFRVNRVSRECC